MPLSAEFLNQHINNWEERLRGPSYTYREKWPSRLFHHAPIENVLEILRSRLLKSREDSRDGHVLDVAAPGVIDARRHAHNKARLYFRPRTPTQFHIEGIRKPADCLYGQAAHAPILVMLVFEARSILLRPDTFFSDRNMQLGGANPDNSEEYFATIPFEKVYHEGGINGDRSIIEHRCAEVLAGSPLPLAGTLQWIYCRSEPERATLLTLLDADAGEWQDKIKVSDDLRVFQKEFVFVEEAQLSQEGLVIRLNPRRDYQTVHLRAQIWNAKGDQVHEYRNVSFKPIDGLTRRWRIPCALKEGKYRIRIELEDHLSFESTLSLQNILR